MENVFSNAQRAEVLTAALPYIKKYNGKIVVIKYGGNAMVNPELKQQVMEDITLLWLIGVKVVLIHGGGPEISEMMAKVGKKPQFINGLRVTDKETIDLVQMVLAGKVNKDLVNLIQSKGGHAIGLEFHEDPYVSYVTEKGTDMVLVPGMIFTIEPMINMGDADICLFEDNDWELYTEDGYPSAQWEIMVLVTDTGHEVLCW